MERVRIVKEKAAKLQAIMNNEEGKLAQGLVGKKYLISSDTKSKETKDTSNNGDSKLGDDSDHNIDLNPY